MIMAAWFYALVCGRGGQRHVADIIVAREGGAEPGVSICGGPPRHTS